jgi:hypothetical protein
MTKANPQTELLYRNNLVQTARRTMFVQDWSEEDTRDVLEQLYACHLLRNRNIKDKGQTLGEVIGENAVEIKPVVCEVIERAKKAGRP